MSTSKKKPALSPQAAKILEQYRSSGQPKPGASATTAEEGNSAKPPPTAPPPSVRLPKASGRGK